VQARPWAFAVGGTLLLLLLAAPVLVLRFGFADESNYGPETTTRKAYELLVDGFGAGANGPLLVVAEVSGASQMAELNRLSQAFGAASGVSFVSPPIPNSPVAPTAAVIEVRPTTGPQAAETEALVKHLRGTVIPAATAGTGLDPLITGLVAVKADVSDFLKSRTGDAVNSVADGLAATARVITAAALIMVFVFGSFVFEDQRAIKMFGLGLAAAVAADASLVRMLIVPSTMELLGARNWWLPGWLDRILPNLNVEGSHRDPAPAQPAG
jgi:RND superfamily putative drug exporter